MLQIGFSLNGVSVLMMVALMVSSLMAVSAGNFYQDFDITWGDRRAKMFNGGQLLTLSLDKDSGSGFKSKSEYLFGRIDMQLKLVSGNSAGTVTAYYVRHSAVIDPITPLPYSRDEYTSTRVASSLITASASNFNQDFDITWGDGRAKMLNNGQLLRLSLDKLSGSGFQSKREYLFGRIDIQLKLVPGNSAGTVTAYYLSSQGPTHDEIDFEFLGNLSGDPYTVHTNVFSQGKGNREQQFHLWFDPTKNFHTYSIIWNPQQIIFLVDSIPIREYKNAESMGVPFPKNQPMRIYSSLWNADDWATRGGLVKTDWTKAPFTAFYRNFNANACVWSSGASSCASTSTSSTDSSNNAWQTQELDSTSRRKLRWARKNYMVYNYCTDLNRFPQGVPPECRLA
ncbi:hypothetical protein HHK36_027154 [Tetracentron sinense]|uniref:Xyloglucan endotransglucosylase/hydrolase n=1 Tax=Tetracentron sinense TaxID=13715 RepID=A0A834YGV7_TETSI|nr:hypothetical protein HHK36_027154 [Tetracentron sinense]